MKPKTMKFMSWYIKLIIKTSSEYDALNRVTKITLPENVNSERKEITPTYNRAGTLEKVSYDGTEYVENIAYNAKGQRLLIAFGNDIMTRYVYDNLTFRLLRHRSERNAKTQNGNTITYTPQSGTNRQDDKYIYDLIGNIFNINIRTTACGIGGSNSLDKVFDYDPLYRVISGTGRENVSGGNYPFPGWDDKVRSSDPNTTQAYTRKYAYDKVGNVQQIKQLGTSGFTRDFNYITNQNKLDAVEIGLNSYNFTYDNTGNQLTENTERHFEWDAANRLLLFQNQVGSSEPSIIAQYLYDSSGNRVKKIVRKQGGDYEIRTYIDGIFEHYTDETDEQNTVHIMDDQSRVATIRIGDTMGDTTPAVKYNLENNIYSSLAVLDDNGTIVNTQEYYPFGETSFGSYGKKRYQYVGKERDEESGLYYYGARYYSAWTCRFISVDPLSAQFAQLSPYNYSDNNPINDYDIDGMQNNNSKESEQGTPPNTIVIDTSKDKRISTSSYLPRTAADGQRIDLVDPDSPLKNGRLINIFDAEKGQWGTTLTYENRYTGEMRSSSVTYQEGWAEESINELSLNFSVDTQSQNEKNSIESTTDKIIKNTVETSKEIGKQSIDVVSKKMEKNFARSTVNYANKNRSFIKKIFGTYTKKSAPPRINSKIGKLKFNLSGGLYKKAGMVLKVLGPAMAAIDFAMDSWKYKNGQMSGKEYAWRTTTNIISVIPIVGFVASIGIKWFTGYW